jgi:hypothetical protein
LDYVAAPPLFNGDMPLATIRGLKKWLDETDSINLNIVVESLIYPHFIQVLDLLASPVPNLHINTNGLDLTPEICRRLA